MSRAVKFAAILALVVVVGGAAAIGVGALTDDDPLPSAGTVTAPAAEPFDADDHPLSRSQARRASRAALRVTGGGTVTELDLSDDPGERYEIEVVKDGREHDIALDANFRPVPNRRYED